MQELGSLALKLRGTDEQKRRFLPRLASGEWLAAYALTEAGSGSDSAAMRSEARRDGDEYVLDGSKRFITNAGVAHALHRASRRPTRRGHEGISAFVVEADTPGFEVGRIEPKMGIKGSTTGELFFDGCRVPAANRIGEEGEGFRIAMRVLDRSRPGIAAQGLGLAQGATDYALEYAKQRETFGEPIARHQLVAGMLADMETRCEAARGLLYRCGQAIDEGADGPELTKLSAMTKLFCTDVAMEVTTDAVQVLGGYGYIQEYPVERMMRDAKITQIYEGTNEIQRLVIAREMAREQPAVPAVELSSRDRVLFPDDGITKGDLFEYYRAVAPAIVPHLRNRPFTMKRWREGLPGGAFFQKQAPKGMPSWIPTRRVPDVAARGRLAARRLPARQLARRAPLDGADALHRHERVVLARRQARPARLRPLRPRPAGRAGRVRRSRCGSRT